MIKRLNGLDMQQIRRSNIRSYLNVGDNASIGMNCGSYI